ncbi:MAG: hypothetical protein Q8P18_20305 [Pseudomonadota bacterium]|nr:hypothetical protein [Pseudomonadota bacterium]
MNTPDIIDLAVAIELECAALYEVFGRCFAGREEVVFFWRIYAEAERYHAASIRIHQAAFSSSEPMEPLEIGAVEASQVLDEIRALRIGYERTAPTIGEALRAARRVEESSAELHGRTQFFKLHPHFAELFQKMAEEDRAHRDVLSTAEQRFGA